jgi:hypothetical protein
MKNIIRIGALVLILTLALSACGPDYGSMPTSELLSAYGDAATSDKAKAKINAELLGKIPTLSFNEMAQIVEQNEILRPNALSEIDSRLSKMEIEQLADSYSSGGETLRDLIVVRIENDISVLSIIQLFTLHQAFEGIDEKVGNISVEQIKNNIGALRENSDYIEVFTLLHGLDSSDFKNDLIEDVKLTFGTNNNLAGLYSEMIDNEELTAAAKAIVKPVIIDRLTAMIDNTALVEFSVNNHADLAQEAIEIVKSRIVGMNDNELVELSAKTYNSELLSALSAEIEMRNELARKAEEEARIAAEEARKRAEEEAARQWNATHSFNSKYSDQEIQDALVRYYMEEEYMSSAEATSTAKIFIAMAKASSRKDNMGLMIFSLVWGGYL